MRPFFIIILTDNLNIELNVILAKEFVDLVTAVNNQDIKFIEFARKFYIKSLWWKERTSQIILCFFGDFHPVSSLFYILFDLYILWIIFLLFISGVSLTEDFWNFQATLSSSTDFTLSWEHPEFMSRKLIGFFIECTTASGRSRVSGLVLEDSLSYSLVGLSPNTQYTFHLIANYENYEHTDIAETSITTTRNEMLQINKVWITNILLYLSASPHIFYEYADLTEFSETTQKNWYRKPKTCVS